MALFRGGTQLGPDASGGHERRSRPHLCVARSQPGAAAVAGPQRRFHLSKLNHEVSEALRDHVERGARLRALGLHKSAPLPSRRSPAVPASVSTAAEWRSCLEQRSAARVWLVPRAARGCGPALGGGAPAAGEASGSRPLRCGEPSGEVTTNSRTLYLLFEVKESKFTYHTCSNIKCQHILDSWYFLVKALVWATQNPPCGPETYQEAESGILALGGPPGSSPRSVCCRLPVRGR